jgi:hypothetical protein
MEGRRTVMHNGRLLAAGVIGVLAVVYQLLISFLPMLLFAVGAAYAQTPYVERIEITEFGIYTVDREIKGRDSYGVTLGIGTNVQHRETKKNFPAQIGTSFGFGYAVIGKPDGAAVNLRRVVVFPPPGLQSFPGKRVPRHESTVEATIGQTNHNLYSLEDSFELVPGIWTVELWYGNRKLATQSFILEKPDTSVKPLTCDNNPPPDTNQTKALGNSMATPIDASLLTKRLPCAENVNPLGLFGDALSNLQRGFDFYSWLTFIALNSPADGSPIDKSKPNSPTKWEDVNNFRQLLDVMVKDPDVPENKPIWGKKIVPEECRTQYKPGMMVVEMIEETFNEPFKTGPLIDQQGNYALFDILMNRQMFDYVLNNNLYSKAGQASKANATLRVDFPAGTNDATPKFPNGDAGAVMIKVSWKVLDSPNDGQNFHTADALVLMPRHDDTSKPPCLRKTLGLVGFHVGHKTVSRRQWIWTSFEHVANVPEDREVESLKLRPSYNFYNPLCDTSECPVNKTPPRPWDPTYANGLKFHSAFRSQITRVNPLTDETKELNRQFQDVLKNAVWKNYMLLSTQWPSDLKCANKTTTGTPPPSTDFKKQPDMNCAPTPTYLANSTLETYSQGSEPLASSSCMACHGNAVSQQVRPPDVKPEDFFNQSDFTFMLEKAR